MNMTVTNLTASPLGALTSGGTGISPDAVGGARTKVLPYPYSHVILGATGGGSVIDGVSYAAAKTLPVHVEDFRKGLPCLPQEPSREWAVLVSQGVVSVSFAADSTDYNVEDEATKVGSAL